MCQEPNFLIGLVLMTNLVLIFRVKILNGWTLQSPTPSTLQTIGSQFSLQQNSSKFYLLSSVFILIVVIKGLLFNYSLMLAHLPVGLGNHKLRRSLLTFAHLLSRFVFFF